MAAQTASFQNYHVELLFCKIMLYLKSLMTRYQQLTSLD